MFETLINIILSGIIIDHASCEWKEHNEFGFKYNVVFRSIFLKGCARYIFASFFLNLNGSTCQTRKKLVKSSFRSREYFFFLHFLKILIFEIAHSLFKLIFKATQLEKVPEYEIFQKTLFCTLVSSMTLRLNAVPVAAGQYLRRDFTFIY